MAYNPRYQMKFNDLKGASWIVSLCLSGYTGPVQQLALGPTPLTIRYDGDQDDIFDTIRTSKADLQVYKNVDEEGLLDDTNLITDKDFYVIVDCIETGYKWIGWLIPDGRTGQIRTDGYYIRMTAVDPFSYAKNALMQVMQDGKPGPTLEGKQNLIDFIQTCILTAAASPDDFKAMITHILNYKGADTSLTNPNADCLQMVACYAENFLDSNGRPKKGQDVIEDILTATGMYTFISQGNYHFRSPIALVPGNIRTNYLNGDDSTVIYPNNLLRTITTKDFDETRFLLENSDNITPDRPVKEVSVHFDYNNLISIMPNSQFANAVPPNDSDGNSIVTGWVKGLGDYPPQKEQVSKIQRIGDGRPGIVPNDPSKGPYAVRIWGHSDKLYEDGQNYFSDGQGSPPRPYSGFYAQSIRSIKAGDIITFELKYRYAVSIGNERMGGYKDIPGFPSNRSPRLIFQLILHATNGTKLYYLTHYDSNYFNGQVNGYLKDGNGWINAANVGAGALTERTIIPSTAAVSTYSFTCSPAPLDGIIEVRLLPIEFDFKNYPSLPQYIDYISVNVGLIADVSAQNYTGETHYQTQVQDYSLIPDTKDVTIGDAKVDTVSGALYKGKESNELTQTWTSTFEPADTVGKPLLQHLVRMWMFFSRIPKTKVSCTVYANDLFFEHLLQFRNGDQDLVEGKFMQMTDNYDVRNCRHQLVCMSLTGAYRDNTDVYTEYFITNDQ